MVKETWNGPMVGVTLAISLKISVMDLASIPGQTVAPTQASGSRANSMAREVLPMYMESRVNLLGSMGSGKHGSSEIKTI